MKRLGVWVVLLVLTAGLGVTASALSLCSYRSPVTALTDAGLSFAYRYYNDAATPTIDVNSGRVGADYDQLFDSPNYGFTLVGSAELTLDAFVPSGWLGQGSATIRFYPFVDALLFAFGGLEASMATGQPRPGVDIRMGFGLGRFTDVTPVAKALIIEEELMEMEALIDGLSDDVLLAIGGGLCRSVGYDHIKNIVADI